MRTFIVVTALCACSQALKLADKVDQRPSYMNELATAPAAPPAYQQNLMKGHTVAGLNSFGGKPEEKAAEKGEKKEEKPAEKAEEKKEKSVDKEVKKEEKKAEEGKKEEKKVETTAKKDEKSAEKAVKKEEKSVDKDVKKDEKSAEKGSKKDEDKESKEDKEDEEEKPKKCSDCVLKAKTCDCNAVTTYLECVRDSCDDDDEGFAGKCVKIQNSCFDHVDIQCFEPEETTCSGKFHQLSDGSIGLEHNKTGVGSDAYCGPNGKCLGKFHMAVNIHNPAPGVFSKCGVPKDAATDFDVEDVVDKNSDLSAFNTCTAAADNADKASCDIPTFPNLEAGDETKSFCVLTDGKDGDFITQVAWQKLSNSHKA